VEEFSVIVIGACQQAAVATNNPQLLPVAEIARRVAEFCAAR
jgi:hypothetical protein